MRFRHRDGTIVHVAYCTNVHPAEDLTGVLDQLTRHAEPVRERLGVGLLGVGLWLARDVATELIASETAVRRLRDTLTTHGLEVVTLNGFPYRGFHAPVVKHLVYQPDWTDPRRLEYTVDLARLLARLLPDDAVRGSVSTLPIGWGAPWPAHQRAAAAEQLDLLAAGLAKVAAQEGRTVRVGIEPEPGCLVESIADARAELSTVDTEWLGLCLDTCHLAVGFEDPRVALAGIDIVKAQASCALQADNPHDPATRTALAGFAESRFLHQTREAGGRSVDDLPAALAGALPDANPWRVHFHMPLHAPPAPPLSSTSPHLRATLAELFGGPTARTDHVEVETYTWPVLPDRDADLVTGIAAELDWTRQELTALGLKEQP